MITKDEEDCLSKINPNKKTLIKPLNPKAKRVGKSIVSKIKKALPNLEVIFIGATALEIAGQNDIDVYVLSSHKYFN